MCQVLDHYLSNVFPLRKEGCRIKTYVLDSELKANLHYKLYHSQYKVPILKLYVSEGPLEVGAYLK